MTWPFNDKNDMTRPECAPSDHDPRRGERGLTLLELLVVIMILSVMTVLAAVQVTGYLDRARHDTAKLQIDELTLALDLYRIDMRRFPTTQEGLTALLEEPQQADGWRGPYLNKPEAIDDPWGRPFIYRSPGADRDYDLGSLGADGVEGGEDDNADIFKS